MVSESNRAEERKEVLVDFDGTSSKGGDYEKVRVADDSYKGQFMSCELVELPSFDKKSKVKKLVFSIALVDVEDRPEVSLYANTVISKASKKGFNNSKLFDLLELAGELPKAMGSESELENLLGLKTWFETVFVGKSCKVLTRTVNKGEESQYSCVDRVLSFDDRPVEEEEAEDKGGK